MTERSVEKEAVYRHAIHVNIGGSGKTPVVTLWCADCLVTVREFGQINSWDDMQQFVIEHTSRMSKREELRIGSSDEGGRRG